MLCVCFGVDLDLWGGGLLPTTQQCKTEVIFRIEPLKKAMLMQVYYDISSIVYEEWGSRLDPNGDWGSSLDPHSYKQRLYHLCLLVLILYFGIICFMCAFGLITVIFCEKCLQTKKMHLCNCTMYIEEMLYYRDN